tara:strand:+ start:3721 stop:5562 length:1842 start_codon:yes stop_codon:yes gene_type:complete
MLKFSIFNNQTVKVSTSNETPEIKSFFRNKFSKDFENNELLIDVSSFMIATSNLNQFLSREGIEIETTQEFRDFINSRPKYKDIESACDIPEELVLKKIQSENFIRTPTNDQMKNLQKLCSLRAGASFSVPGAGKTTEALAFFAFHKKNKNSKLLVISPINAFISWDDEIKECFRGEPRMERLRGTIKSIQDQIDKDVQFMILNYDGLRNPQKFEIIKNLIIRNPDITVILDESHKIKGDQISQIFEGISPYINTKLILTGTPMPQAPRDLVSQFNFLYPDENIYYAHELLDKFEPIYVRTTKKDLGLMPIKYDLIPVNPHPAFAELYDEYFVKKLNEGISLERILSVNSFKIAVLKFLKLLSNPKLCMEDLITMDASLAVKIDDEGDGAKIDAVLKRANELIEKGEKVLIWSSFVRNVEIISDRLGDTAVFIHGGVKAKDNNNDVFQDLDSREAKINRFKNDPTCMALVANPAAAAESISLHKQCNYALYLDRSYNAGQFLQSQDRIHRLIDKKYEQQKYIEIFYLDLPWCLDWKIHYRLNEKIENMANFLNDKSLQTLQGFDYDSVAASSEDELGTDKKDEEMFYSQDKLQNSKNFLYESIKSLTNTLFNR